MWKGEKLNLNIFVDNNIICDEVYTLAAKKYQLRNITIFFILMSQMLNYSNDTYYFIVYIYIKYFIDL